MPSPDLEVGHEAARVYHALRWCGGRVAGGGAGADEKVGADRLDWRLVFSICGCGSPRQFPPRVREHGYVEGQNLTIDIRWLEGKGNLRDEAAHAAAELIRSKVDVLAVQGPAMDGVLAETRSFPVVMVY